MFGNDLEKRLPQSKDLRVLDQSAAAPAQRLFMGTRWRVLKIGLDQPQAAQHLTG